MKKCRIFLEEIIISDITAGDKTSIWQAPIDLEE